VQTAVSRTGRSSNPKSPSRRTTLFALALGITFNGVAAEPALTLAMAKPELRMERRVAIVRPAPVTLKLEQPVPQPTAFAAETFQGLLEESSGLRLHKPIRTASLYPFAVVRRPADSSRPASRWASASIEPGFGDFDADKPVRIYGRNGTGWEEPSVGYVKIHVKF
jgi:hypothetical protein